jgi:hypothetical protein
MKDFSRPLKLEPIRFKADGDTFEAIPELSAEMTMQAVELMNTMGVMTLEGMSVGDLDPATATPEDFERARSIASGANKYIGQIMAMLDELLLPKSAERFAERLKDKVNPITLLQAIEIWKYLVEQYTGRPTSPSSSSTNGHDDGGTSSTVGVQREELTP